MVSITLSVSDEVREIMKRFPEINWSALVRKSIEEKAKMLLLKQEMLSKLEKDKTFNEWAVDIVRKGRKNEARS
jgi:hypothetical protein